MKIHSTPVLYIKPTHSQAGQYIHRARIQTCSRIYYL